jgi:hypothetical protein
MIMRCPAWLQHLTPRYLPDAADDIAAATAALTALLAAETTANLIAQTPKSAPTLRSLCRMFGIAPPSWLTTAQTRPGTETTPTAQTPAAPQTPRLRLHPGRHLRHALLELMVPPLARPRKKTRLTRRA